MNTIAAKPSMTANGPHTGAVTHHHDQSPTGATFRILRVAKMRKRTVKQPMPPPEDWLTVEFFFIVIGINTLCAIS